MSTIAEEAKAFYAKYRQQHKNLFAENIYLFYPQHYQELNYHLENMPNLSSDKYKKNWNDTISKQEALEDSVLRGLGVSFPELQLAYAEYRPSGNLETSKDAEFNTRAQALIYQQIEKILEDNDYFLNREVPVNTFIKQNLANRDGNLYRSLDLLYENIKGIKGIKSSKVSINILNKIASYRYLADSDISNARERERKNITDKQYTIDNVITSITNSLSGTMNNIKSRYDETITKEFLNKGLLDIKSVNGNVTIKAVLPKGGKKVKADVRATIKSPLLEKPVQFGISNKIGTINKIKLHSGGNIDALVRWIGAYKDTSDITGFLKSNEFRMMLANELYSGNKGEALEALQQLIQATVYIWIGNEFMMEDNALAQKLLGGKTGNYNIAFISSNRQLYRVSSILRNISENIDEKNAKVDTSRTRKGKDNYLTQKRNLIKTLPTYWDYAESGGTLSEFPYPQNLLNIGNAASNDYLKRIRYTINLDKNIFQP